MAERSAAAARARLVDALQRCVSCVSQDVLVIERVLIGLAPNTQSADIALRPTMTRLRAPAPLFLDVNVRVESRLEAAGWQGAVLDYQVAISDGDEREIVAYHWHPRGVSPVTDPHLHIGAGAQAGRAELSRAHLPTGMVTLAGVVALLVEGFGVRPRRAGWRAELGQARAALLG